METNKIYKSSIDRLESNTIELLTADLRQRG
jgi:hypothetical protein